MPLWYFTQLLSGVCKQDLVLYLDYALLAPNFEGKQDQIDLKVPQSWGASPSLKGYRFAYCGGSLRCPEGIPQAYRNWRGFRGIKVLLIQASYLISCSRCSFVPSGAIDMGLFIVSKLLSAWLESSSSTGLFIRKLF